MTPELALLKRLLVRSEFDAHYSLVNVQGLRAENPKLHNLYVVLELMHRTISGPSSLSVAEFEVFFFAQFPFMREGEKADYRAIFQKLETLDVSSEITDQLVLSLRQRSQATTLARAALAVVEGSKTFATLEEASRQLTTERVDQSGLQPLDNNLAELLENTYKKPGLRWRLDSLNKRLGSIRKGDFGFIFARPESGKTTFLVDQGIAMARDARANGLGPVLWFNNEEMGKKVMVRAYQAYFQLQLPSLYAMAGRYWETFATEVGTHFLLFDSRSVSKQDIEAAAAKYSPSLIIIDQIDKVYGFEADRNDLELGEIYIWARGLAKQYCPLIGVTQSDGSGEGVKWLTMAHVANAKTSKQAEADWILGIGKTNAEGHDSVRHFYLSKNKLFGDPDSDPNLRHDRWDVLLKADIARYEDL